jgi:hypothetical protein
MNTVLARCALGVDNQYILEAFLNYAKILSDSLDILLYYCRYSKEPDDQFQFVKMVEEKTDPRIWHNFVDMKRKILDHFQSEFEDYQQPRISFVTLITVRAVKSEPNKRKRVKSAFSCSTLFTSTPHYASTTSPPKCYLWE